MRKNEYKSINRKQVFSLKKCTIGLVSIMMGVIVFSTPIYASENNTSTVEKFIEEVPKIENNEKETEVAPKIENNEKETEVAPKIENNEKETEVAPKIENNEKETAAPKIEISESELEKLKSKAIEEIDSNLSSLKKEFKDLVVYASFSKSVSKPTDSEKVYLKEREQLLNNIEKLSIEGKEKIKTSKSKEEIEKFRKEIIDNINFKVLSELKIISKKFIVDFTKESIKHETHFIKAYNNFIKDLTYKSNKYKYELKPKKIEEIKSWIKGAEELIKKWENNILFVENLKNSMIIEIDSLNTVDDIIFFTKIFVNETTSAISHPNLMAATGGPPDVTPGSLVIRDNTIEKLDVVAINNKEVTLASDKGSLLVNEENLTAIDPKKSKKSEKKELSATGINTQSGTIIGLILLGLVNLLIRKRLSTLSNK